MLLVNIDTSATEHFYILYFLTLFLHMKMWYFTSKLPSVAIVKYVMENI